MTLGSIGFCGLGAVNDATVLEPGTVLSFKVVSSAPPCGGIWEEDIRNTLNNWASQMIRVDSVAATAFGNVPLVVDVDVTATVLGQHSAGSIRTQIMSALAALSESKFWTTCAPGVELKDGVLNVAAGGSYSGKPPSQGIPWSTTLALLAVSGLAAFVIAKVD